MKNHLNWHKTTLVLLAVSLMPFLIHGQDGSNVEMADVMRSNGKIYVVIGVLLIIFAVIIGYLIRLEMKIRSLEKNNKSK